MEEFNDVSVILGEVEFIVSGNFDNFEIEEDDNLLDFIDYDKINFEEIVIKNTNDDKQVCEIPGNLMIESLVGWSFFKENFIDAYVNE